MTRRAALLAFAALAGCRDRADDGPIDISVIGAPLVRPLAGDVADRGAPDRPARLLAMATRQGLVRFDAAGQVAPGLAARWSLSENGRSLLFRLPDSDAPFSATQVARRLRAAIAPGSRNPLKPLLGAVGSIDAVTPQVIDIELTAPRPTILPLFADPALGIGSVRRGGGPFDIVGIARGVATLRAMPDPDADPDTTPAPPLIVRLRGERAGTAVARFAAGSAAFVTGGTVADLAIARAAALPAGQLRFDPVQGLFGFVFAADGTGAAASPAGRRALAMAIDRDRIARALDVPDWSVATAILPDATPEIITAAQPDWAGKPFFDRRVAAAAALMPWRNLPPLRVAMPAGPGMRLLFALIASDWATVGIPAVAVAADAPADLRLIDEVAPADTAAFYLRRFACERQVPCSPEADAALVAAREASTLDERSRRLAQADGLIEATVPFAPIGAPVRWSLVASSLDRYAGSPRALHPFDALRTRAGR